MVLTTVPTTALTVYAEEASNATSDSQSETIDRSTGDTGDTGDNGDNGGSTGSTGDNGGITGDTGSTDDKGGSTGGGSNNAGNNEGGNDTGSNNAGNNEGGNDTGSNNAGNNEGGTDDGSTDGTGSGNVNNDGEDDSQLDGAKLYEKLKAAVEKAEKAIADKNKDDAFAAVSEIDAICGADADEASIEAVCAVDGGELFLKASEIGAAVESAFAEPQEDTSDNDASSQDSGSADSSTYAIGNENAVDITVKEFKTGETDEEDQLPEGTIVTAHYVKGVSNGQAVGTEPLVFRLEAKPGWKHVADTDLTVSYQIQKTDENDELVWTASSNLTADANHEYTIRPNGNNGLTGADRKSIFTGEIAIKVVADTVTTTLDASDASVTGDGIYFVDGGSRGDLISGTSSAIDFSKFTEEVTIAVVAEAEDTVKMAFSNGTTAGEAAPCERTSESYTEPGEGGKTWTYYTIDPRTLEKYDEYCNLAGTKFIVTKEASATYNLTFEKGTGKYTLVKTDLSKVTDTDETHYFSFEGASNDVPTGITNKNYLKDANKTKVFAFEVTPNANVKLTGVKAELTKDSAPTKVLKTITAEEGSYKKTVNVGGQDQEVDQVYYTIDMSSIESELFTGHLTLTIGADTEYKLEDDDFSVHNIEFTGDVANVEIRQKADNTVVADATEFGNADALSTSFDTDEATFHFAIKPKKGYDIARGSDYSSSGNKDDRVVTISYTKRYELTFAAGQSVPENTKDYYETAVKDVELSLADLSSSTGIYKLGANVAGLVDSNGLILAKNAANGDDDWLELLPEGDDGSAYKEKTGSNTAAYSLKNIRIHIGTTTVSNQSGHILVDSPDLEYSVVTGNGVEQGEMADKYLISEEADFVTLNITSPTGVPTVTYNVGEDDEDAADAVPDGETYKVTIPVAELHGSTLNGVGSSIESTISITKGDYHFVVKNVDSAEADFAGNIKIGKSGDSGYYNGLYSGAETKKNIKQGETVPVVLYAQDGTEFDTVKVITDYDIEDKEKTEEISLGDDKATVELSLAMTGNVKVTVTTKPVYHVALTFGAGNTLAKKGEDGVYEIPAGTTNIKATLTKSAAGTAQTIAYAKLYDGDQEAATKVSLMNGAGIRDVAKITKIDEKDTGVLRLELAVNRGSKLEVIATLQMRQEQMASKMAIVNTYDNSVVTGYNGVPDSEPVVYQVKAEEGSLAFADSNILMELATDATKTGTAATNIGGVYTVKNSEFKAEYTPATETDPATLKLTALPSVNGGYKGVLRFYDKAKRAEAATKNAADKICAVEGGTIEIALGLPAVKTAEFTAEALNATNTALRLQVSSDIAAYNDNLVSENSNNKVFYRVTLDAKDKIGTGTDPDGNAITRGPLYFERTGSSQVLDIYVYPELTKNEPTSLPAEFHPTVELVQTTKAEAPVATKADAETQGKNNKLAKSAAIALTTSTKEARYEHTLTLSPAKATVYLGQQATVVTKAQFGENTGFANIKKTEFVNTKTNKVVSDGAVDMVRGKTAKGEVTIDATAANNSDLKNNPDVYKNLGLKIYAETADGAMSASAVLPLSVVAGVKNISFENGYNQNIFKQPGKAATLKVKAVLNGGAKENAPKKKQFTYSMGDKNGKLPGEDGYSAPSYAIMSGVTVDAKKGTVTVKKDFVVDAKNKENNKFSVVAKEIYSGADAYMTITVTDTAQAVGSVVIVDNTGKVVSTNGVLKADDFYNGTTYRPLYVRALSSTAGVKRAYGMIDDEHPTNANYMTGVKYTSSAKSALAVDATNGELTLLKAQAKPVKLTVASADGSKDKGQSIEVSVQGFSAIGLWIVGDGNTVDNTDEYATSAVEYDGVAYAGFDLYPMVRVNGKWRSAPKSYFKNFNVKFKKAKKMSLPKTATEWKIVKTDCTSEVTITDKSNKDVTMTYVIAQKPQVNTKAPKIKALTKLAQPMVDGARNAQSRENGGIIKLRYEITGKDKGLYARQYMLLTPDYTKTGLTNKIPDTEEWRRVKDVFLGGDSKLIKIGANDTFEIDLDMWRATNEDVIPGNYTMIATAGTYKNGQFVPSAKGATIKIKIPGKAPKTLSLKLNGSYDLDESGSAVDLATGISGGRDWWLVENTGDPNYALNKIDPETGKPNAFRTYFKVWKDVNGKYWLGLQSGLTLAQIEGLRANEKDREGYVTVETGDQRQDMLISVNLVDSTIDAMTKDSYKGAETTVQFCASGNGNVPIEIAGVWIDQSKSQGAPSFVKTGKHIEQDNKSVKVKLDSTEEGKSYEVTFKVLPKNSAYATAKGVSINDAFIQKYGREVKAAFYVCDPAKAKGAVWFEAVDDEIGLAFTAYNRTTYDTTKNIYKLDIEQKCDIDGAKISAVAIGQTGADKKAFENAGILDIKKKSGSTTVFTLTLDRDKFMAAAKKGGIFSGDSVDIPVDLTYENKAIPAETVYVNVAMPNPMDINTAIEAAKEAVKEAEQIRVIDVQNPDNNGDDIRTALENKVNEALMRAIPLDTQAVVNLPLKLAAKTTTGSNPVTTWEATLTIKEKKSDSTAKWSYDLKFAEETVMLNAEGLKTAISALTIDAAAITSIEKNDHKLDNEYSADKLRADILKLLGIKSLPENLDIVVRNFQIKKATVKAPGKVTAKIFVRDALNGELIEASNAVSTTGIVLPILGDMADNAGYIETVLGTFDYQKVIYDTLKAEGASLSSVEGDLKDAILAAARDKIANSGMTVDIQQMEVLAANIGNYDNTNKIEGEDEKYRFDVGYKLPTADTNGKVEFKLVVRQSDMKAQDYIIDKTDTNGIAITPTREIDGKDVKVFQTLGQADTNVSKTSGDDAIFTGTAPDSTNPTVIGVMKEGIDKKTDSDIAAVVEERVKTLVTGVGLGVNATVDEYKLTDGSAATGKTPGGDTALHAYGTIAITDKLGRAGTGADAVKTLKYKVEIPADGATVSSMTLKATQQIGSEAEKPLTLTPGTPMEASVTNIGTGTVKIKITPELKGYWLTAADNDFDYTLAKEDGTAPDAADKLDAENGFSLANGVLTITPNKVATTYRNNTGVKVQVKVDHKKAYEGENGTVPSSRKLAVKITLTFTTPTTAKALLEKQTSAPAYDWNATSPVTAEYEKNADGAWVFADEDTLKTNLVTKANSWLKLDAQGTKTLPLP